MNRDTIIIKDMFNELFFDLNLLEKVEFKGHVQGVDKENLHAESMAVLPSETENFGNVVVESLNQGTPVIASKGTPWEMLEKFNSGFHVVNTPQNLSSAFESLFIMKDNE